MAVELAQMPAYCLHGLRGRPFRVGIVCANPDRALPTLQPYF